MPNVTTAQALGKYRRELIEQGFTEDVASHMSVEAARLVISDGGLLTAGEQE